MTQNWGSWTPWTPIITASTTSPTMGSGVTQRGGYTQAGTIVHWWAQFAFGTSPDAGSGFYQFALPVAPVARDVPLGNGFAVDASASGKVYPLIPILAPTFAAFLSTSAIGVFLISVEASGGFSDIASGNAVPFVWAASDQINVSGCYEAATS